MKNSDMTPNRFLRWAEARRKVSTIVKALDSGATVDLCTYTKVTRFKAKHRDMFRATKAGAYVQRGKSWDCFDGCAIRVYR